MSNTDELLAQMEAEALSSSANERFIVDKDLRTVTIPETITVLGVEHDDDVHRLYFQLPKMYGEFDLSEFDIRINYVNAADNPDMYPVDDKDVSGDNITFSWLVGRTAFEKMGDVVFNICLRKTDSDGVVIKEFNTTIATLPPVLEGLETTELIAQQNPDVIESILQRLGVLEENGGTDDYSDLNNKPRLNGVTLEGNKTLDDVGIQPKGEYLTAETDPTVPEWAKTPNKPTYTAEEVGAQPKGDYLTKETDPTVPAWAKASSKPIYTAEEVGAEAKGVAASLTTSHNQASDSHNDIRLLIQELTTRLNTLADSDDITLDQMSEIVDYIKSNKSLIDGVTTGKVSVSDIVNNLTTNVENKPLSAAQGVALKTLIDAIVIPEKLPNPNKLIFTGVVTDEYDGSVEKTITIPTIPEDMETITNKVTTIDDESTDAQYPSAKAVNTLVGSLDAEVDELKTVVDGITNDMQSWIHLAVLADTNLFDKIYNVGDQFVEEWTDTATSTPYTYPFQLNHIGDVELQDGTVLKNRPFLQAHYAHPFGVQFSHQRAFLRCPEGLSAGTYYFTIETNWGSNVLAGDIVCFTLTEDVPAGGRIAGCYGAPNQAKTNWRIYSYSSDCKTILETVVPTFEASGTDLGTQKYNTRNGNLNSTQEMAYGWNRWSKSALRQYLNSIAGVGEWWAAQDEWDIAPDQLSSKAGFLSGVSSDFLAALKEVKVTTYANTVNDGGVADVTYDKVFLPSLEQMHITSQIAGEGEVHEYWKQRSGSETPLAWYQTYTNMITYAVENHTSPQHVLLRSASRGGASGTWCVYSSGYVNGYSASNAFRFSPLVVI